MGILSRLTNVRIFLILAAVGLCVYANAVFHPFVHDDVVFIALNPNIGRWDNLADVFLQPGVPFASMKITTPYYRPVLEIFYRMGHAMFGMDPAGFHFLNIVIHVLNSFLVFLVGMAVGLRRSWALGAALLFLIHPINSEAVACVAGISNLVVTFFLLAAFLGYHRAREGRGWLAPGVCLVSALAAFLTKEQAVVLPLMLLAYEVFRSRSSQEKAGGWGLLSAAGLLTAGYLAWRQVLFAGAVNGMFGDPGELWLRIMALPRTLVMDIRLFFWPSDLHYYRSVNILDPAWPGFVTLFAGAVLFGLILRVVSRQRRVLALFGLAWFLIGLLPMMNVVPLVNEYAMILTAEHFLYFPVIGLVLIVMALAGEAADRLQGHVRLSLLKIFFYGVLGTLASVTVMQNTFWRGEVPLFERTLRFEPGLGRVHLLLGKAYAREGRFDEAFAEYTTSLKIMQEYVTKARLPGARSVYLQFIRTIHFDRGQCFATLGLLEESSREYTAAIATPLDGIDSMELDVRDGEIWNNLGMNGIRSGDRVLAKKYFERALMADPRQVAAMNNLGMFWLEEGNATLARFWFERSLKLAPGFGPAWENLKRLERSNSKHEDRS